MRGRLRFDVIYGTVTNGNTSATAGVQRDDTFFTQYFCNGSGGAATGGQSYVYFPPPCPTPTPSATPRNANGYTYCYSHATPTPTATATATATATFTPTPTQRLQPLRRLLTRLHQPQQLQPLLLLHDCHSYRNSYCKRHRHSHCNRDANSDSLLPHTHCDAAAYTDTKV